MEILFIFIIPYFNNLYVLFCSLNSLLDINLLYVLFSSIIILGGLSHIKLSSIQKGLKNIGSAVIVGAAAKAGADIYDYGKGKIQEVLSDNKTGTDDSSDTNSSDSNTTDSKVTDSNTTDSKVTDSNNTDSKATKS